MAVSSLKLNTLDPASSGGPSSKKTNHHHSSVYVEMSQTTLMNKIEAFSNEIINSTFTDIIFGFINICAHQKGDDSPFETSNHGPDTTLCSGDYPEVTWNMFQLIDDGLDSVHLHFARMAKTKKLWISVGAFENDETFSFFKSCKVVDCRKVAGQIKAFIDEYSITGVDLDFEATSIEGFEPLIKYMKEQGVTMFSTAPYSHQVPGKETDLALVKANVMGPHWQYCQFRKHNIEPLINVQYYAGGYVGGIDLINKDIDEASSKEFLCNGQMMKIPKSSFVAGMGVAGSWHSESFGYQCTSQNFEACNTFMDRLDRGTGGVFTWRIEAVDEFSRFGYAASERFSRSKPPLHAGRNAVKIIG